MKGVLRFFPSALFAWLVFLFDVPARASCSGQAGQAMKDCQEAEMKMIRTNACLKSPKNPTWGRASPDSAAVTPETKPTPLVVRVSLDTQSLKNHPAGPFALEFQLTDGNPGHSEVLLTNFDLRAGNALEKIITEGGAKGSLSSQIKLTDSAPLNDFQQTFEPGYGVSFDCVIISSYIAGVTPGVVDTPDGFSLAILDKTGAEIPAAGGYECFLIVHLHEPAEFELHPSLTNKAPRGGGPPIFLDPPKIGIYRGKAGLITTTNK